MIPGIDKYPDLKARLEKDLRLMKPCCSNKNKLYAKYLQLVQQRQALGR